MSIKKLFDIPLTIGRKAISYAITDPAGEICFLGGYSLIDDSLILSVPLLLFSAYHIPRMIKVRKKLNDRVQKNKGLTKKIIKPFNRISWCSHRVAIAYSFGQGKYKEFKEFLHQYSTKYYIERLKALLKKQIKNLYITFTDNKSKRYTSTIQSTNSSFILKEFDVKKFCDEKKQKIK